MSKQKTKKPVPRAPGSAPTKSTSASTPTVVQLRELLAQAGHFPRPTGRPGHRVVDHDPIPEGHEEVTLVRADRGTNNIPHEKQPFSDVLAAKKGVRVKKFGAKSFEFEALNDDGADAIAAAFEEAINREASIALILPAGAPAPQGWTVKHRRPSPIDERGERVRDLRVQLEEILPALMNDGALPSPKLWQQVLDDDLLDEQTIGEAIATIDPKDPPSIKWLDRKRAAIRLGWKANELSKVQRKLTDPKVPANKKVPAWARSDAGRFKHLLGRNSAGHYDSGNIEELAAWKKRALAARDR